jgi:hypothetical protein
MSLDGAPGAHYSLNNLPPRGIILVTVVRQRRIQDITPKDGLASSPLRSPPLYRTSTSLERSARGDGAGARVATFQDQ